MSDSTIARVSVCDCLGRKPCDCPCHIPTRDNTNTDDDLELDRLKARVAELEANQSVLRDHIDTARRRLLWLNAAHDAVSTRANEAVRLLEAERTERQRAEIERDEWRDKARVLSAQVLDVLKMLGVQP